MTLGEVKEQLEALLETLPEDKAQLLLDFAAFLKQQTQTPPAEAAWDAWDRAIIEAEDYWFSLPEKTRRSYMGKTAAVVAGQILDADSDRATLRARVRAKYSNRPVLYVEGEAERLQPLVVLSPRLR